MIMMVYMLAAGLGMLQRDLASTALQLARFLHRLASRLQPFAPQVTDSLNSGGATSITSWLPWAQNSSNQLVEFGLVASKW